MPFPSQLDIPEDVLEIAGTLKAAGHEAWCVGGAIRDTLLGENNTDYDVATSATPDVVKSLFKHTVPVGERFGTVAVRTRRRHHEVTTFRKDVTTDGRHAVVEFGVSLEDDLARRDFTVNAIAYEPLTKEWRDPFHGAADLDARLIKAVGVPLERFREDYLRILRAIRFASRFEFRIDPATWGAAQEAAPGTAQLSAERVRDEWYKTLRSARSLRRVVQLWWASGVATVWMPELLKAGEETAPPPDLAPENPLLRRHDTVGRLGERAALLPAYSDDRGIVQQRRDPVLLTTLLCRDPVGVLIRLKAPGADIARAAATLSGPAEPASNGVGVVRRWMAAVGDAADDLAVIWTLRHGVEPRWEPVMHGIRERGEPLTRRALAVNGTDLIAIGVDPGPGLGAMLDRLLAIVIDEPAQNTRENLLALARSLS
jgi:tRNA nucleotidyltransferase (CCA-adding enzyme)